MAAIAYNLIASPFAGLGARIMRNCEIIGYARAANALRLQGYHKQAQKCMRIHNELKNK